VTIDDQQTGKWMGTGLLVKGLYPLSESGRLVLMFGRPSYVNTAVRKCRRFIIGSRLDFQKVRTAEEAGMATVLMLDRGSDKPHHS
jgi:hypothetical protein